VEKRSGRAFLGLVFALGFAPSTLRAPARTAKHVQEPTSGGTQSSSPSNEAISGTSPGQTITLLPDGSQLLLGGTGENGATAQALIKAAGSNQAVPLPKPLIVARAWHTATLLPNGTVLVLGGIDAASKVVDSAELYDPVARTFRLAATPGLTPRAYHTATLLTDGTLLVAGGVTDNEVVTESAEIWNPQTQSGKPLAGELSTPRRDHIATLLSDGTVLMWGGTDANGQTLNDGDIYDPESQSFSQVHTMPAEAQLSAEGPTLAASVPEDGAQNVPLQGLISVRLSERLNVTTVNSSTVTLSGPAGSVPVTVVPAETGMLAFATYKGPLFPEATYTLSLDGLADAAGRQLPETQVSFTTAAPVAATGGDEVWVPTRDFRTGRPESPWSKLPPLQAPEGVTAVAGQVLKLNGEPLPNVTLEIGSRTTRTDSTGRFLLADVPSGRQVLVMDGSTASHPGKTYGVFEYGPVIKAGITNALPFTIWMPLLDTAHKVTIPSPTKTNLTVTSPLLPGLELRLPAGTVVYDYEGRVAHQISITPIPLDRTPFPLPNVQVPIYFTIQPGGGWLKFLNPSGPQGAQLIYPNTFRYAPGTPFDFWNYDAGSSGWYIYGLGKVSPNGLQVIPDPGVLIYEFTGAIAGGAGAPTPAPPEGNGNGSGGEPVDLSTGLLIYTHTDLVLPDVIALTLTRTYRQSDPYSRAFGIGATHPYDIFLWTPNNDTDIYLILPDGGRIHFPSSNGYECTDSPTSFYGATLTFVNSTSLWTLKKKDGTVLTFPESIGDTRPQQAAIIGYQDRYGNTLTFTRDSNSNLTRVTSPNGRYLQFTLDSSGRITQATDNIGRTVSYAYDSSGRLSTVTDADGGITTYAYDSNNNMISITDPRRIQYLTNVYDSNNRVTKQTTADAATWRISYMLDGNGNVTEATLTDPRNKVRQTTFDSNGYTTSDTLAVGTSQQEATTFTRSLSTELISDTVDPLSRETHYTYDSLGNTLSVTQLYNTSGAVTTSYTYDPTFSQVTSITDPLNHVTNFTYDSFGNLTTLTDPLNHQWTFAYNSLGQPVSATDPLSKKTTFEYSNGDLASVTDPLGRTTLFGRDGAGRLVSLTDPLGAVTQYQYDGFKDVTQATDPLGNITSFLYDPDRNLSTITDALKHVTTYTYNNMDRLSTRKDPLGHSESYTYDLDGNPLTFIDRKSQKTTFTYDPLNRRTKAAYADGSSTSYTYDLGNRLTKATDSISGTISRSYDNLDRLTQEMTPQGSVSFKYDAASRRTTMTVAGQTAITYGYDKANRLLSVAQGSSKVTLSYDNANRRTLLTLPNGVSTTYGYDFASELTSLTYKSGSTTLGTLTYTYDAAGRRTSIGGSYARTGLPAAVTSATYNKDNQLTQWRSSALTYDLDGNLTSDGTNTYAWNARNQLASINSGTTASFVYDGFARRQAKTVTGASTSFLYDRISPVQELSGTVVTANLVTGLAVDEIFSRTDSAGARYFVLDALRSTIALADSTGTLQTQYTYEPFGSTTVTGLPSSSSYHYTGREDDGTGVYYYRARYYNTAFGRFISQDPLDLKRGSNSYAYVDDRPINANDPLGLFSPTGCAACLSTAAAHGGYCWAKFGDPCQAGCAGRCDIEGNPLGFQSCINKCFLDYENCLYKQCGDVCSPTAAP
jgi:RHS repeat-associated protein